MVVKLNSHISSSVLEVGEELGVEDCVAVLDVVDGVEGVDRCDRNDCEDDWNPDGGLLTSDNTSVCWHYWRGISSLILSCSRR